MEHEPIEQNLEKTEYPIEREVAMFKPWRQLKLRVGVSGDGFIQAIQDKGMQVHPYSQESMKSEDFILVDQETELALTVISVKELTGNDQASLEEIIDEAKKKGYQLCPNQVGPESRLQYEDQPKGEELIIGMKPIRNPDGIAELFAIENTNVGGKGEYRKLLLNEECGSDRLFNGWQKFIFLLPSK